MLVVVEMEEREDSYQCLWVGKIDGLASWSTWIMNVFFSGLGEEEDSGGSSESEKMRSKRRG